MMLHEVKAGHQAANRRRKRIGRGESSGQGKTAGRGHKGAGQRAGRMHTALHEGGRTPYFRRMPKRGFSNFRFKTDCQIVNVGLLDQRFDTDQMIDPAALAEARIIRRAEGLVKILGDGEVTKALTIKAHKFSASAAQTVKAAGGTCEEIK